MDVAIPPRGTRTYTYDNQQPAATLWTHDHTHHRESEQVYRGLSGQYLITDPAEDALGLPAGRFDVPLVLRDAAFDDSGELAYSLDDAENRTTVLVNGRAWPRVPVRGRRYRFRIVNACNLRFFVLRLADGSPITQIGSDGGLLPAPFAAPVVVLSPGERADVVIDFARYAPGTGLVLENLIGPGPVDRIGTVLRFDVGEPVGDPSRVPDVLAPLPPAPEPTVDRAFALRMAEPGDHSAMGHGDHAAHALAAAGMGTINGKVYDPARIDTTITWGTTERWTVTNTGTIPHNFHTHLVQFRVLDRDGAPPSPAEAGWKDTVSLFPGQSVRLLATFDTHRGTYPYHCHMIDHSAMGMMAQLQVV
jgi:spore coat protein A, manganese oxidase